MINPGTTRWPDSARKAPKIASPTGTSSRQPTAIKNASAQSQYRRSSTRSITNSTNVEAIGWK